MKTLNQVRAMNFNDLNDYMDVVYFIMESILDKKDSNPSDFMWSRYAFICRHWDSVCEIYGEYTLD